MQHVLNFFNPQYTGKQDINKIPKKIKQLLVLPLYIFSSSFIIGNLLFVAFMTTKAHALVSPGFIFLYAAFIINILFLLLFIVYAFMYKQYALLILQKASVLLLNIPVAILYTYLVLETI